ncbi:MAG: hypothetical protein CL624_04520 [Arcobacter sp.]|nr:hypothetical protein [Arcobacter sp.]|tara:strand:- start:13775 stop:14794 length:1020 start_codon:yes stop_codon:yes gene_type:complete
MFGAKYRRLKFWIISICLLIPLSIIKVFVKAFESSGDENSVLILYTIGLIISIVWINTLANRIRDYGSNPWISLFALIPLVNIGLALYYGIAKSKSKPEKKANINSNDSSLTKAVYNHSKDIAGEIKPAINEYKEKHSSVNQDKNKINVDTIINEDEIYEKVMLEIEEDRKVKSTWAKALAQSEGNKDKAESLYINFRFINIKKEIYNKTNSNIQITSNLDSSSNLSVNEIDFLERNGCTEKSINVISDDKIIRIRNRQDNVCIDRFTNKEFIIPTEKFEKISSRENAFLEKKTHGVICTYCETLNSSGNPYCYKCKKPITLDCLIESYKKIEMEKTKN